MLFRSYQKQQYHEAEDILRHSLERLKKLGSVVRIEVLMWTQFLACILAATERDGEAEELHRQVIETLEEDLGPDHRNTTRAKRDFARFYEFREEFQKAASLRYQIFEAASNQFGVEHPDTLDAMFDLAQSLRGAGRDSEALRMIQECLSTLALAYEQDSFSSDSCIAEWQRQLQWLCTSIEDELAREDPAEPETPFEDHTADSMFSNLDHGETNTS